MLCRGMKEFSAPPCGEAPANTVALWWGYPLTHGAIVESGLDIRETVGVSPHARGDYPHPSLATASARATFPAMGS